MGTQCRQERHHHHCGFAFVFVTNEQTKWKCMTARETLKSFIAREDQESGGVSLRVARHYKFYCRDNKTRCTKGVVIIDVGRRFKYFVPLSKERKEKGQWGQWGMFPWRRSFDTLSSTMKIRYFVSTNSSDFLNSLARLKLFQDGEIILVSVLFYDLFL